MFRTKDLGKDGFIGLSLPNDRYDPKKKGIQEQPFFRVLIRISEILMIREVDAIALGVHPKDCRWKAEVVTAKNTYKTADTMMDVFNKIGLEWQEEPVGAAAPDMNGPS